MTLQIELEPHDLQVLADRAAALGVPIERAARQVLVVGLHSMNNATQDDAEFCRARQLEIIALANAAPSQWARVQQESIEAGASFYQTPAGHAELADWRALQGEDFMGFEAADTEKQRETT